MEKKFVTEMLRRIYDYEEGHFMTVMPSPDFPDGNVCLLVEASEQEHFGDVRIDMPAEFMRLIGEALIAAAADVRGEEKVSP